MSSSVEPIIHVCIATRWAETNLLPVLSGPEPDAVIVLVAQRDPPTAADETEAVTPAERTRRLLRTRLPNVRVELPRVPSDRPVAVQEQVGHALDEFAAGHVILNVTGGQKLVCFAALGGVDAWVRCGPGTRSYEAIYVRPGPPPSAVTIASSGSRRNALELQRQELSVDEILSLRGLGILKRQDDALFPAAAAIAMTACSTADLSARFGNIAALNKLAKLGGGFDKAREGERFPRTVARTELKLRRPAVDFLDDLIGQSPDGRPLGFVDGTYVVPDRESLDWLAGGWFEECCFLAAKKWAGNDGEVLMNVELRLADRSDGTRFDNAIRELDVVVWRKGLMHVIEAKTGVVQASGRENGINQDTINKLLTIRREIVGSFGTVSLVNPRPMPHERKLPGYELWRTLAARSRQEQIGCLDGKKIRNGQSGLESALKKALDS